MGRKQRRILHVDDDPQMLRFVKEVLRKKGYEVISIEDPHQALDAIVENNCRVVLLDIDMLGVSGLDLLQTIKNYDGGIQVVMLTGLVSMSTVLQSMRWGAEACIFKPLTDFVPLLEATEATFIKVDRWWRSLEDLSQRKQLEDLPTKASSL